jgi:hypothetical protein
MSRMLCGGGGQKLEERKGVLSGGGGSVTGTEPLPSHRQVRQVRRVAGAGYDERNKRIVESPSPTRTS